MNINASMHQVLMCPASKLIIPSLFSEENTSIHLAIHVNSGEKVTSIRSNNNNKMPYKPFALLY